MDTLIYKQAWMLLLKQENEMISKMKGISRMSKHCYAIGGRINFNQDNISLCHGIDIGDQVIWRVSEGVPFTYSLYNERISQMIASNQTDKAICAGCSNLIECVNAPSIIDIVTINPMNFCQCRCVYCGNFWRDHKSLYNPLQIIKEFIIEGLIAKNCLFDWGGGEPTISDVFEELFLFLLENGYMQRVNTNAYNMSELVYNNLDNDLVSLRISLDSGNSETYFKTKGKDVFDQVIDNIKKYRTKTDNIVLKYVVTNTNSSEESIQDFVELANSIRIKAICIDTEMYSFGKADYKGMLSFTENELNAAKLLQKRAHEIGVNVQIGYVWTAQNPLVPSRDFNQIKNLKELIDENEKYKIPDVMPGFNLRRNNDFINDIYPVVLPSLEFFIANYKDKKIVLYGAGNNGEALLPVLQGFGFQIVCCCDKNKVGQRLNEFIIRDINDIVDSINDDTVVLLTPYYSRDIVIDFNEHNYYQLKNRLLYIDSNRYCKPVLDSISGNGADF